ncbi:44925_t:CDS:1, partial [Gigaspora margarita]
TPATNFAKIAKSFQASLLDYTDNYIDKALTHIACDYPVAK